MQTHFDPELSRLAFEDRLLEYIEEPALPLLDRIRLLAIFAERMDVFFMTRVGLLKRLVIEGEHKRSAAMSPQAQLEAIAREGMRMTARAYTLCRRLLAELRPHGIEIVAWTALTQDDLSHLRRQCGRLLADLVRPDVIGADDAFPHVRNLRPTVIADARVREGQSEGAPRIVIAELPAELPRLVPLPGGRRFVPLERVIGFELPALVPNLEIGGASVFRVTRNGHTELDDDEESLQEFEREIVQRPFQEVVRLEVESGMPESLRDRLLVEFGREAQVDVPFLGASDTYAVDGLVDLTALEDIAKVEIPGLRQEPVRPRPVRLEQVLLPGTGDTLIHFPFDDYETSLEWFLREAAAHPELESLQTTIYRTDRDSDVVAALCAARERGAEATAVVEVKASFDERENIERARALDAAGVRVVLPPSSLKVHAKMALATFRGNGTQRRVAMIGTGNMNAITSRAYIDLWLVTRDPTRTGEVAAVFERLTGGTSEPLSRGEMLLVSPFDMRQRFLELIEGEIEHAKAGRPAKIRAMMNGLSDRAVIAALYRASQAGVPVELMVRGLCLLRPGAPGISENIRVISIAGFLLQHARIYHFHNAGDDAWFIGSADWRPRNFDVRVEVITRVTQADHRATLERLLTETLAAPDAWELQEDGVYRRLRVPERARDHAGNTSAASRR
jgi:polyphosphate kinase